MGGYGIDINPDFTDVPASTWSGIDVGRAFRSMCERAGVTEAEGNAMGLAALARRAKPKPLSPEMRARLADQPELVAMLDDTQRRYRDD